MLILLHLYELINTFVFPKGLRQKELALTIVQYFMYSHARTPTLLPAAQQCRLRECYYVMFYGKR